MENSADEAQVFWIRYILLTNTPIITIYIFSIGYLAFWNLFTLPLFVPLLLIIITKLVILHPIYQASKTYSFEKYSFFSSAIELIFWFLLVLVNFNQFPMIFAGIPIYILAIFSTLIDYKNPSNFSLFVYILSVILNWIKVLTYISVSLKSTNLLNWSWVFLFWPIWLSNILAFTISLLYITGLIIVNGLHHSNILGASWLVIAVCSYSITLSILIIGLSGLLESGQHVLFRTSFFIAFGILTVQMLFNFCIRHKLKDWVLAAFPMSREERKVHPLKLAFRSFVSTISVSKINSTLYRVGEQGNEERKEFSASNTVKECLICCANECDSVLVPCGHAGVCNSCAIRLLEMGQECHICRAKILQVLKLDKEGPGNIVATEIENEE